MLIINTGAKLANLPYKIAKARTFIRAYDKRKN